MRAVRICAKVSAIVALAAALCIACSGGPVHAAGCPGSPSAPGGVYGRRWNCSYFNNTYGQFPNQYNWLLISQGATHYNGLTSNWQTVPITYSSFVNSLHARVFDTTNIINASRASAIVDIMLGKVGTDFSSNVAGVSYAKAHWTDFTTLVSTYDSGAYPGYSVNYNVLFDFSSVNSNGWGLYDPNPSSDFSCTTVTCYPDAIFATPFVDTSSDLAVVFYYPGGQFIIKDKCGNLTGDSDFPPMPPPATATCGGYTTSVAAPDPNQAFNLTVAMQYTPNVGATTAFGPDTMSVQLSGPSGFTTLTQNDTDPSIVGGVASTTLSVPATGIAGTYNVNWQVTGSQLPNQSCSDHFTVAYAPYFDVAGGDTSAGQGFGSGCTDNPAADIKGENLDSAGTYFGAGTRQAAIATGVISRFATDTTNNISANIGGSTNGLAALAPGGQPKGLALANSAPASGTYGGGILGSSSANWCVPDFANSLGATTSTVMPTSGSLSALPSNVNGYAYKVSAASGSLQLNGDITLQPGVHVVLEVTGGSDLYLNGNVYYATYNSFDTIPWITIVVQGGNLHIDSHVTTLHGFYVAQPDGGSGGLTYTCASGPSTPSKDYSLCNQPLTVYGSVAAKQVIFGRTAGDVANGVTVKDIPAERIVMGPELWLGAVSGPRETCVDDPTQTQCLYQEYTNLPPTL